MNKYVFKMMITLMIGLFVMGGIDAYGQLNVPVEGGAIDLAISNDTIITLRERGFDSAGEDKSASTEARDFVMVGSKMHYFIMPDQSFNSVYFRQDDWQATNWTKSWFDWFIPPNAKGYKFVNTNLVEKPSEIPLANTEQVEPTSPWIIVEWGTVGPSEIVVREFPELLFTGGSECSGTEPAEIPIMVINEPTIKFTKEGALFENSFCVPSFVDSEGDPAPYPMKFPVSVTTESPMDGNINVITVYYDLIIRNLTTNDEELKPDQKGFVTVVSSTPKNETDGRIETTIIGNLVIEATEHGHHEVTITKITDYIAEKCEMDIPVVTASVQANITNIFTFSVMPQPRRGRIFHVPNRFR